MSTPADKDTKNADEKLVARLHEIGDEIADMMTSRLTPSYVGPDGFREAADRAVRAVHHAAATLRRARHVR